MNELREERGTIITWLDEETIDGCIDVISVWKWLLRAGNIRREQ
jgi:predicted AAA+ superfamily ATPase